MKRLYVLFLAITLFYGCKKEGKAPSNCAAQMQERFKAELKCTEKGVNEINLYSGLYKNEEVYFTMIMCINCGTIPPAFGYTCKNKKVDFDDFRNVENIKEVYNSCTQKFIE